MPRSLVALLHVSLAGCSGGDPKPSETRDLAAGEGPSGAMTYYGKKIGVRRRLTAAPRRKRRSTICAASGSASRSIPQSALSNARTARRRTASSSKVTAPTVARSGRPQDPQLRARRRGPAQGAVELDRRAELLTRSPGWNRSMPNGASMPTVCRRSGSFMHCG